MPSLDMYDFSGGVFDEGTENPPTSMLKAFNILISDNKKPYVRPGVLPTFNNGLGSTAENISAFFTVPNNLPTMLEHLLALHGSMLRGLTPGSPAQIQGPSGNDAMLSDSSTCSSVAKWRDHVYFVNNDGLARPQRMLKPNKANFTSAKVVNAGLPLLPSAPTIVSSTPAPPATNNYIYAFLYHYTYTVSGITYEDFGAIREVLLSSVTAIGSAASATITLPVLAAAPTHNYDTANLKVQIYRTQTNQSEGFYLVTEVTNGTPVVVDTTSDATLVNNQALYTEGGEVENDEPPICRYIHGTENYMYYTGLPSEPNIVLQSKFSDPDSVPEDFIIDVESEVIGIGSIQNIPIVFTTYGKVYRIEGAYDDFGRGAAIAVKIADEVYLRSHGSIVTFNNLLFFVARDGVYTCNGQGVQRISNSLNDKFKQLAVYDPHQTSALIQSTVDAHTDRIFWTIDEVADLMPSGVSYGSRLIMCLHTAMGISDDSCFTFIEHPQTRYALIMARTEAGEKFPYLFTGAQYGFTNKHYNSYSEVAYDKVATSSFVLSDKTVLYDLITSPTDFGEKKLRKWVTSFHLEVENPFVAFGNTKGLSVQPVSYNDLTNDANFQELRWRNSGSVNDSRKLLHFTKRFPAKSLRCNYKSVQLKNALSILANSDTLGNVSVVGSNVVLVNFPVSQWPTVLDYQNLVVYFDYDNYTTPWPVTSHSSSDLVVTGTPTVGVHKFILKGYNIGEALSIHGMSIEFEAMVKSNRNYKSTDSGANV